MKTFAEVLAAVLNIVPAQHTESEITLVRRRTAFVFHSLQAHAAARATQGEASWNMSSAPVLVTAGLHAYNISSDRMLESSVDIYCRPWIMVPG